MSIREKDNAKLRLMASLLQKCVVNPGDYVGHVATRVLAESHLGGVEAPTRSCVHSLESVYHPFTKVIDRIVHTKRTPGDFSSLASFMFSEIVEIPVRFYPSSNVPWSNATFTEGFYVDLTRCLTSARVGEGFPELTNVRITSVDMAEGTITVCMPGIGCEDRHYEIDIHSFQRDHIKVLRCAPFLLKHTAVLPNGDRMMVDPREKGDKNK